MTERPFHLAYPVTDLEEARRFFTKTLGAKVGREATRWVDLDFFGHQLSLHLSDSEELTSSANPVDGDQIPALHFGCILPWDEWTKLHERLLEHEVEFILEKKIRFEGECGEQGTFFLRGPCGIALEFKSFKDPASIFAH